MASAFPLFVVSIHFALLSSVPWVGTPGYLLSLPMDVAGGPDSLVGMLSRYVAATLCTTPWFVVPLLWVIPTLLFGSLDTPEVILFYIYGFSGALFTVFPVVRSSGTSGPEHLFTLPTMSDAVASSLSTKFIFIMWSIRFNVAISSLCWVFIPSVFFGYVGVDLYVIVRRRGVTFVILASGFSYFLICLEVYMDSADSLSDAGVRGAYGGFFRSVFPVSSVVFSLLLEDSFPWSNSGASELSLWSNSTVSISVTLSWTISLTSTGHVYS